MLRRYVILDSGEHSKFSLDRNVILARMGVFADLLCQGNVLVVRQMGTVYHDAGEAVLDAVDAQLVGVAVVEVQNDGNLVAEFRSVLHGSASHVSEQVGVGILACSGAHLHYHRALGFDASLDYRLHLFHVVEVVRGNGIAPRHGLLEQVDCIA